MRLVEIIEKQSEIYKEILARELEGVKTEAEIFSIHSSVFKDFYTHAFRPTLDTYTAKSIDSAGMNTIIDKTTLDIEIAHEEIGNISRSISDAFDSNKEYKTGLRNKVEYLTSIIEDVNLMAEESINNSIVFKDSLNNYDFVDKTFGTGQLANIATSEGVAFLAISNDHFVNDKIHSVKINGNGQAGNYYTIKKVNVETFNDYFNMYAKYKSDEDAHDNPESIMDGEDSTWFEYQKLGVDPKHKADYNINWGNANKIREDLTLKIDIELLQASDLNWIDISPYIPEKSKSNISLYSVRVSEDGSNYSPIYKNVDIIDREINIISQNHTKENLFSKDNITKFTSQGVLNFPLVKAKFIEIILKQTEPYNETLGVIVYNKTIISGGREINKGNVTEQSIPSYIAQGPVGKYKVSNNEFVTKQMVVLDGWRYSIGVRDIELYNRRFERQSEIVTKRFKTVKPIKKAMLYANEIIPEEYNQYGLDARNEWIKYYISINDIDWYPISPMHHNQVGKLTISPKIYEINSIASIEEKSINKGYLVSKEDVTSIRLKIVFSGSGDIVTSTPILEEYALKCVIEGGLE